MHQPTERPVIRAFLRLIAYSIPFGAFVLAGIAYLNATIPTIACIPVYLLPTAAAGAFDHAICLSIPKRGGSILGRTYLSHSFLFTLIMSVVTPVAIISILFAACAIGLADLH